MKKIHFIAIGGSAMHNLAIELFKKGYKVSGSDDKIFEPSLSNLKKYNLLPDKLGWNKNRINKEIDFVIIGMHAKKDNPELIESLKQNIRIFSYPEFLYEFSKLKTRVVISGSHGKTSISSMILHVLKYNSINVDYMLGAQLEGFDTMVKLKEENEFILIEGDEYLSSPLDLKSKFLWYKPNIALISGISWDHINVFPTFNEYTNQFRKFIDSIVPGGVLVYNESDKILSKIVKESKNSIKKIPYNLPEFKINNKVTFLNTEFGDVPLMIFGKHNLENLSGAKWISQLFGINSNDFYEAISIFKGASRRLELLKKGKNCFLFKDFAHSPSKVFASCSAISDQYFNLKKVFCLELHTYSSLDNKFIELYSGSLNLSDEAIIFYDLDNLKLKKRDIILPNQIKRAFNNDSILIFTNSNKLSKYLCSKNWKESVLLMMSSGDFGGIKWNNLKSFFN